MNPPTTDATLAEIPGWFTFPDLYRDLVDRAAAMDRPMVEVGVWCGKSLLFAANYAREKHPKFTRIVGVDTFEGSVGEAEHARFYAQEPGTKLLSLHVTLENRRMLGLERYAHLIVGQSVPTAELFADGSLACVFIDAGHRYQDVLADVLAWGPKVAPGGVLAGHDVHDESVRRAVRDALMQMDPQQSGTRLMHYGVTILEKENCWVIQRRTS
jgi:hypothetical protein